MSSGELRHYVELQTQKSDPNDNGDYAKNTEWDHCTNFWARIIYQNVSEDSNDRDFTEGKATIKIRYRKDITNKMRIVFDGRNFDIENNFDPSGRRQYLMLNVVFDGG